MNDGLKGFPRPQAASGAGLTAADIGVLVQAYSAALSLYAAITPSANIQSLLGAADYAAARTALGLGSGDTPTFGGLNTNSDAAIGGDLTLGISPYGLLISDNASTVGIIPHVASGSLLGSNGTTTVPSWMDAATVRTLLGLVIGTNVQAYSSVLTTYAGINPSANVQSVLSAADYAAIRSLLGLVIGTNIQAYDAELAALAGLTSAADKLPYFTGSGTASVTTLTAFIRTLLDDTNAATALATLGAAANGANSDITSLLGSLTAILIANTGEIRSGVSAGDYFALSGYNEDTATYEKMITVTSVFGPPTLVLVRPSIGAATGTSVAVTGALTSSGTAGIGYATGAGGTVTQATNKTTGVTIDKTTGTITMNNAALAAAAEAKFTVTNSTVAATDVPVVAIKSGGTSGSYMICVSAVAAGSFDITISNVSGGSLSEAIVVSFVIIKGVAA